VLLSGLVTLQIKPWRPERGCDLPKAPKLSQSGRNGSTPGFLGLHELKWPLSWAVSGVSYPGRDIVLQGALSAALFSTRTRTWGTVEGPRAGFPVQKQDLVLNVLLCRLACDAPALTVLTSTPSPLPCSTQS
jgi:hypothetical protein